MKSLIDIEKLTCDKSLHVDLMKTFGIILHPIIAWPEQIFFFNSANKVFATKTSGYCFRLLFLYNDTIALFEYDQINNIACSIPLIRLFFFL